MSSQEEQVERRKKRDMLAQAGMDPYTAVSHATHTNTALLADFTALAEDKTEVTVVGRVMALRLHGGSAFADVFDGTARLQIFLSKDVVGETLYDLFASAIDAGDFIEATGVPFVTKRETLAVGVNSWRVLTKALQSIPADSLSVDGPTAGDAPPDARHAWLLANPDMPVTIARVVIDAAAASPGLFCALLTWEGSRNAPSLSHPTMRDLLTPELATRNAAPGASSEDVARSRKRRGRRR